MADQYLDYLIDPSFQGLNRLFVLTFQNNLVQIPYKQCFLPNVEIIGYNVMINGKNVFEKTFLDVQIQIQQCFSLLKKQKKPF